VSRKSKDNRWNSKFGQFVRSYGVELLATRLSVDPTSVYHWIARRTSPDPANAQAIQRLARRRRITLSLDDIYQHRRGARSHRFAPHPLQPQPAA
jgi:hypothetical protein